MSIATLWLFLKVRLFVYCALWITQCFESVQAHAFVTVFVWTRGLSLLRNRSCFVSKVLAGYSWLGLNFIFVFERFELAYNYPIVLRTTQIVRWTKLFVASIGGTQLLLAILLLHGHDWLNVGRESSVSSAKLLEGSLAVVSLECLVVGGQQNIVVRTFSFHFGSCFLFDQVAVVREKLILANLHGIVVSLKQAVLVWKVLYVKSSLTLVRFGAGNWSFIGFLGHLFLKRPFVHTLHIIIYS